MPTILGVTFWGSPETQGRIIRRKHLLGYAPKLARPNQETQPKSALQSLGIKQCSLKLSRTSCIGPSCFCGLNGLHQLGPAGLVHEICLELPVLGRTAYNAITCIACHRGRFSTEGLPEAWSFAIAYVILTRTISQSSAMFFPRCVPMCRSSNGNTFSLRSGFGLALAKQLQQNCVRYLWW